MGDLYSEVCCIHSLDESTNFLSSLGALFRDNYVKVDPSIESVNTALDTLRSLAPNSLIVFLGHGQSAGLYAPESIDFQKSIMINADLGNRIFTSHDVLMLSCKSGDFIRYLNTFRNIIGFGNIPSSLGEIHNEAETTGVFRNLSNEDVNHYNSIYVNAIINALKLLLVGKVTFDVIPKWISFFLNKEINSILREKDRPNRIELSKLLFEFRNEMVYKRR
ncbi:hypothetical protein HF329_33305 [Chitinophaga oryzae]|uniref:Uncharacterized protein n=1 Tax=Chitinophaga oryzae TaxID=2725414 RepID=A0AAE7DB25_9BACT|nr:hypothetical protein [Chitinophaga oryzae]QJB35927.1 hypothetical protein HF329_33305 [Chitinophaga oryzae]